MVDKSRRIWPILITVLLGIVYFVGGGYLLNGTDYVRIGYWAAFPLTQFVYVGPMAYIRSRKGARKAMQGWLIGALVAALLLSPCWFWALLIYR